MGETKLGSGRCTQTARLSSSKKENGSRAESTLGEGQNEAEKPMIHSVKAWLS